MVNSFHCSFEPSNAFPQNLLKGRERSGFLGENSSTCIERMRDADMKDSLRPLQH